MRNILKSKFNLEGRHEERRKEKEGRKAWHAWLCKNANKRGVQAKNSASCVRSPSPFDNASANDNNARAPCANATRYMR